MIKDLLKLIFYAFLLVGIGMVLFIASELSPIFGDLMDGNYKGPTATTINVVLVVSMFGVWCWVYKGFVDRKHAAVLLLFSVCSLFLVALCCCVYEDPLGGLLTLQNFSVIYSVIISAAYSTILFVIASLIWPPGEKTLNKDLSL